MRFFVDENSEYTIKYELIEDEFTSNSSSIKNVLEAYCIIINGLRKQRHDFLNHLQVLYGYAQLNKTAHLKGYIKETAEDLRQMGEVFKISDLMLQALLIEFIEKLQQAGHKVVIDIQKSCFSVGKDDFVALKQNLNDIVKIMEEEKENLSPLFLKMYRKKNKRVLELRLSFDLEKNGKRLANDIICVKDLIRLEF